MPRPDDFCRICVKEKTPLIPIMEDNKLNIREKMLKLLKIKIAEESPLPKHICLECLTKLNNFNEFYVQSNENQVILQVLFHGKVEVEENPISSPVRNIEISTQTDPSKASQERYFIIEELTSEGNEAQQIAIVSENEIDNEQYDISIQDDIPMKSEDSSLQNSINVTSLNTSSAKKRNRFDRFDCYICHEELSSNFLFLKHFSTFHPNEEVKYQCHICKGYVKIYRSFTRHMESHVEKRFECDICNQKFSQKATLTAHLSSHSNIKNFKCVECNLSFKQNSSLFKHRKQKHSNDAPKCLECNKSFINNETLQQHIKSKHNQYSKDIGCDECDKVFASKSALTYHKSSSHSKGLYQCEKCEDIFKNKLLLARHKNKCLR